MLDKVITDDGAVTWICRKCGTRIKPGQPHRAEKPTPHATLRALIVEEDLPHVD